MLKFSKNQSIAILLLLVAFFASATLSLMHGAAHQTAAGTTLSLENKSQNSTFLDKFIFSHQNKNVVDCAICSVFNLQNQLLFLSQFALALMVFHLVFLLRFFDRVKLSYLSSSYCSRAPPYNL